MSGNDGGHMDDSQSTNDTAELPLQSVSSDVDSARGTSEAEAEPTLRSSSASDSLVADTSGGSKKSESEGHTERSSRWEKLLSNTWLFDSIAISFSLACLIAVAAVLFAFDNKGSHPMPYGITLNAIVSTLATASKASLLCAVAGSIGQLKWSWFEKPRNLYDLQAFDDVGRGPTGAVAFLYGRHRNASVAFGALITLVALMFDPFIQQIIRYPNRLAETPSGVAQTRKAHSFPTDWSSTELVAAVYAGIWSKPDQFERSPHCSSGHCDWEPFESFGWCSECRNATAEAKLTGECDILNWSYLNESTCTLSFGKGKSVTVATGNMQDWMKLTSEVIWPLGWTVSDYFLSQIDRGYKTHFNNLTYMGVRNPPVSIGYAAFDAQGPSSEDIPDDPNLTLRLKLVRAEQCILTPCVRTYNITSRQGTTKPEVLFTNYGITKFVHLSSHRLPTACWQPDNRHVEYNMFYNSYDSGASCTSSIPCDYDCSDPAICDWWNGTENAFCPIFPYGNTIESFLDASMKTEYTLEEGGYYPGWGNDGGTNSSTIIRQVASHNLTYIMDNLAASLTDLALDLNSYPVNGRVMIRETYVNVRWPWFTLPVLVETAGLILFLATVLRTRRRGTVFWQSSLLPFLFGGIDQAAQVEPLNDSRLSEIELRARSTTGQLLYATGFQRIPAAHSAND